MDIVRFAFIMFFAGILNASLIYFLREWFVSFRKKSKSMLPLWDSWVFSALLRMGILFGGYIFIGSRLSGQKITHSVTALVVFAYTLPLLIGIIFDVVRLVRNA